MKKDFKLLITCLLLFFSVTTYSQVNYEHTYLTSTTGYGQEFWLTNLGNNNYKYVIYNYDSSSFSIYNLNHTPYLTNIQIPFSVVDIPTNTFYRLGYITSNLFDCDSTNIEYAIMLDGPKPTLHPNFAVYRTDGTLIFSKDSVGTMFSVGLGSGSYEMHPIMNTPVGAKLYLFNGYLNGYNQIFVYSLCGPLPENIKEINQSNAYVKVFPNPTSNQITFQILTSSNVEKFELTIFNAMFQVIKSTEINGYETHIELENESLSSGMYYYSLQNKNQVFQTGKFIFSK